MSVCACACVCVCLCVCVRLWLCVACAFVLVWLYVCVRTLHGRKNTFSKDICVLVFYSTFSIELK